jgi:hypothetical protein
MPQQLKGVKYPWRWIGSTYVMAMHTVVVLALDQVVPFDLATPLEDFGRVRLPDGRPGHRVRVCAATSTVDAGLFRRALDARRARRG